MGMVVAINNPHSFSHPIQRVGNKEYIYIYIVARKNLVEKIIQVMELDAEHTSNFMPAVIPRLDRLDRLLQLLEEKHSLLRRDFSGNNNNCAYTIGNDDCKTLTTVLEEVQHKGTLMERLSTLENRVLQLSLEMDEENTSKYSSSSTFQICSETTAKKDSDISIPSRQEREDHEPIIQPQEGASSAHEFVTKRRAQDKSKGGNQKRKIQRKWLGLFRFRLTC
ncbi:hypothetical protein ACJIZ3_025332 [Penstemon smallii]|uniref:Uncharacterized protein n=1 Tax=Penstemon smallii TaxID=265156 RepID=A0ABD3TUC7_9LAMI